MLVTNKFTGDVYEDPNATPEQMSMQGVQQASPEQAAILAESQKYDQPVKAAALGFSRANLPVISDTVIPMLGLDGLSKEDLQKIKEHNPIATTVGEVGGYLNPLNPLNKVAGALKIPAALSKVMSANAVSKVLGYATGSAIEGAAIYGTAQAANESVLGDTELLSESSLATIGLNAAFGGGVGLAIGTASHLLPSQINKLRDKIGKLKSYADDLEVETIGSEPTFSKQPPVMPDLKDVIIKKSPPPIPEMTPVGKEIPEIPKDLKQTTIKAQTEVAEKLTDHLNGILDGMDDSIKQMYTDFRPAEIESSLKDIPKAAVDPISLGVNDAIENSIRDMSFHDYNYSPVYKKKIEAAYLNYTSALKSSETSSDVFNAVLSLKKELQGIAKYDIRFLKEKPPEVRASEDLVRGLANKVRNVLREESYWGQAAVRQSNIDDALSGDGLDHHGWYDFFTKEGPKGAFARDLMKKDIGEKMRFNAGKVQRFLARNDDAVKNEILDHASEFSRATNNLHDQIVESYSNANSKSQLRHDFVPFMKELDNEIDKAIYEYHLPKEAAEILKQSIKEKAAEINLMNKQEYRDFVANREQKLKDWEAAHKEAIKSEYEKKVTSYKEKKEQFQTERESFRDSYFDWKKKKKEIESDASDAFIKRGGLTYLTLRALGVPTLMTRALSAAAMMHEAATNPIKRISALRAIEENLNTVLRSVENTSKSLVNASRKYSGAISASSVSVISNSKDPQKKAESIFNKRVELINSFLQDQNVTLDRLNTLTSGLHEHAPQTSDLMQSKLMAKALFLQSKIPQHESMGVLSKDWTPSKTEMAKFNAYYDAANNPMLVLKQAANGTMTKEGVETLITLYPSIYNKVKESILEKISDRDPSTIPYQNKLMISMLLGSPMMISSTGRAINATQQAFANTMKQAMPTGGMPKQRIPKLDNKLSENMLTPLQKSIGRK